MTTNHSSVQELAIKRAITLLQAAKAEFAIRCPDGTVHGELPIAEPKVIKRHKVNDFRQLVPGYIDQIKAMQPGDVLRWTVGINLAEPFRKAVSSVASNSLGKGRCISTLVGDNRDSVEILRVE